MSTPDPAFDPSRLQPCFQPRAQSGAQQEKRGRLQQQMEEGVKS